MRAGGLGLLAFVAAVLIITASATGGQEHQRVGGPAWEFSTPETPVATTIPEIPSTTTTSVPAPPTTERGTPSDRASRSSRPARSTSGSVGRGDTEACIIARENGGSYSQGTNPTHFGRYQFSRSTWVANSGNPNTWGTASPAEQDRVFRATVSRNGYRDWTPYDGC